MVSELFDVITNYKKQVRESSIESSINSIDENEMISSNRDNIKNLYQQHVIFN
jgi:hypothetical protein